VMVLLLLEVIFRLRGCCLLELCGVNLNQDCSPGVISNPVLILPVRNVTNWEVALPPFAKLQAKTRAEATSVKVVETNNKKTLSGLIFRS